MFLLVIKISSFRRFRKQMSYGGALTSFLCLCDGKPIYDNVSNTVTLSFSDSDSLSICSHALFLSNVVHRILIL